MDEPNVVTVDMPPPIAYASFTARARALVIDSIVMTGCLVVIFVGGALASAIPGSGRVMVIAIFSLALLYEPLFVSRRGATIGHGRVNLQVVTTSGHRPGFARALARYLIKGFLGVPAFLTMLLTRRHQAVHDLLTGTIVRVVHPEHAAAYHVSPERPSDWMQGGPSILRRLVVIIGCLVLLLVAWSIAVGLGVSSTCLNTHQCTLADKAVEVSASLAWLAASAACITFGWLGRLPGARRQPPPITEVPVPTAG